MSDVQPFKVSIPEAELDLLRRKLEITRIPDEEYDWTEENGTTNSRLRSILDFWRSEYDWRSEEERINQLPQFMTKIEVDDAYGILNIHFVHSLAVTTNTSTTATMAIPLLFLHGWPGSFIEISKGLTMLNEAGFDVVAPSLPGYGFSSYTRKKGFDHRKHAEVMNKLMVRLGYEKYVVQGGDWGSGIARALGIMYPERVKAVHQNMLQTPNLDHPPKDPTLYSEAELTRLDRAYKYFIGSNSAYSQIYAQRPLTSGTSLHDSPIGLLSTLLDKLTTWSDNYPWTNTELITWTLLHYFPGPTPALLMYHENNPPACMVEGTWASSTPSKVPSGYSSFPQEIIMVPQRWAEQVSNCVFYRIHDRGGHFAMYECPELLVGDLIEFFTDIWSDLDRPTDHTSGGNR